MPRLILLQQILPGQQKDTSWLCLCSQLDFGPCSWEPEAAAGSLHPHSAAWKQAGRAKHARPQSWEAEPARGRGRELLGWALWDPLQQGHPWGAHSPATAGNSKLTLSPVPSAESSLHPGVTSPAPGLPPAAPSGAVLEAGTHTALVPLHQGGKNPIPPDQGCSLTPSQQPQPRLLLASPANKPGLGFHSFEGESQPQPALHSFPLQQPESWSCRMQAELPQPTRISPPGLAPGLAAPEVGPSSLGEQGETEQLCTCPQLTSDLFRRKSGLSGMKELEAAAWGWHKTA